MINTVVLSEHAKRNLRKVPHYIFRKLMTWVEAVELRSLEEIRKVPGYHDEPLAGSRKGQRSIRLNRSYRAIYVIRVDKTIEFVNIEEVSKHEY